ncbi:MAG: phosphodiesterase [Spirochaetaceae bacterium]|jgi:putative phosphoesterase|nr:phosphodiesterase [Spirochaetaceae bacterium]
MKYLIISDIHGSVDAVKKALDWYEQSKADFLLVLGDMLYHGPRNLLPGGHNPQGVVELLNRYHHTIIAVRGNCDAEVDQLLLDFPCMSDYALILDEGRHLFLTHGHVYKEGKLPYSLPAGSVIFSGHTHIPRLEKKLEIIYCNPGSISLPRTGNRNEKAVPTFAVYESKGSGAVIMVRRLDDDSIVNQMELPGNSPQVIQIPQET